MKKYLIEFIGTFFLVLTIGLSANPIAIGVVLAAMVYMGGYISGAHYNPAVTLGVWLRKKISTQEAGYYVLVQLLAALIASLFVESFTGAKLVVAPGNGVSFSAALLAEIFFTFALVSVVLNTAVSDKVKGNDYYGLAIGLTVMAGAFSVGAISGGAFNPAVGLAPNLYDIAHIGSHLSRLALYILGPGIGAVLASYVHGLPEPK